MIDKPIDTVHRLATDMGVLVLFSGDNDGDIMLNSAMINLNIVEA
jgi:GDP-D-mannose 3', 5'-epimerase